MRGPLSTKSDRRVSNYMNPTDCKRKADASREMADRSQDEWSRHTFLENAAEWERLAEQKTRRQKTSEAGHEPDAAETPNQQSEQMPPERREMTLAEAILAAKQRTSS